MATLALLFFFRCFLQNFAGKKKKQIDSCSDPPAFSDPRFWFSAGKIRTRDKIGESELGCDPEFFQPLVLIRYFARTNLDQKLSSSSEQLSSPSLSLSRRENSVLFWFLKTSDKKNMQPKLSVISPRRNLSLVSLFGIFLGGFLMLCGSLSCLQRLFHQWLCPSFFIIIVVFFSFFFSFFLWDFFGLSFLKFCCRCFWCRVVARERIWRFVFEEIFVGAAAVVKAT